MKRNRAKSPRALALGLVVGLPLVGLGPVTGCASTQAVVEARELKIEAKFVRRGLAERTTSLGPHRVHRWASAAASETDEAPEEPGRPVLLLHGFGPPAPWQWHPQVESLTGCRPILMPDLLGFGESHTQASPTLSSQVDALVRLLDDEGVSKVDVVGVSYGGMVAMELAVRAPERVTSLMLVSSPGRAFAADDQAPLVADYGVSGMHELLLPRDGPEVRRLLGIAYAHPPRVPRPLLDGVAEALYADRRAEKAEILHQIPIDYGAVAEQPWRVEAPTMVVWGAEDRIFPLSSGLRLMSQLEGRPGGEARMVVVPRAGHVPHLERSRAFNRALLDWLDCR